ncbi:Peptidase M23 (plasmid) [Chroococcidiopsis thermalis PCC 7203]|uniref:Peptidase M23 n=1 Tax=Chroococcidiopsis thermalis (strain PCC 7203) TaxID=251229 RepID=K9U7J0_CHRTP|nr:M23 family metallopeptidase [Chroococcidiopsis thermalis]AFY91077.1 Peptidase M23 [Chroococcidiopsis thermalis PCC 7203]
MNKVAAIFTLTTSNKILEEYTNSVRQKNKRWMRTATVTLGLVVSTGASNLLMIQQSDRALAVKLTSNEPTVSTIPIGAEVPRRKSIDLSEPEAARSRSPFNPHVQKLRMEVERLQQKYSTQSAFAPRSSEGSTLVAPLQPSAPSKADSLTEELNFLRHLNSSAERSMKPKLFTAQVPDAPKPAIKARHSTPANTTTPKSSSSVVTAPIVGLETSGMLDLLKEQQISPDLPPLGAVDTYLPKLFKNSTPAKYYAWPAKGSVTSNYGRRWGRMHQGIDIAAAVGMPIFASAPGVVVKAGWNSGGYGNLVEIQHSNGSLTRYAHNQRVLVRVGQQVGQGQQIAQMGSTGRSSGPHSHFELHLQGKGVVNPIAYLPRQVRV